MLLSTPGIVLHTTPYAESSVVAKVFTRQLGLRSYLIKGVRGRSGRVKQNMLQPLSCLDMVVYDNPHSGLNYTKELSPRHPAADTDPISNALRFFMTEVLYKALREDEPMPELWDYVEQTAQSFAISTASSLPIHFLLTLAHHLGIAPLDNYNTPTQLFDLQEGRYVASLSDTTLSDKLSLSLHLFLIEEHPQVPLETRRKLIDALITYYHLHLSGFAHFHSHDILHTLLK